MTGRLRGSIGSAYTAVLSRLRRRERGGCSVKGCMRNVIVVKPDDPIFREAVFILRDDYFSSSKRSRRELIMQAKDAARSYTDTVVPPRQSSVLPAVLAALFTAAVFAALILTGVI